MRNKNTFLTNLRRSPSGATAGRSPSIANWIVGLVGFALILGWISVPIAVAQDEDAAKAAKSRISKLRVEFLREMKKLKLEYAKTKKSDERAKVVKDRRAFELKTVKEVVQQLKKVGSDKTQLSTLTWYVDQKVKGEAMDLVIGAVDKNLTQSKYAAGLATSLGQVTSPSDRMVEIVRQIADGATSTKNKGTTRLALADMLSQLENSRPEVSEEVDSILNECIEKYGKVRIGKERIADIAKKKLGDRRFMIGKVAPDIEGVDLDDVNFKLSDYRGKVVVLDFWGDW